MTKGRALIVLVSRICDNIFSVWLMSRNLPRQDAAPSLSDTACDINYIIIRIPVIIINYKIKRIPIN